jgi:sigma-B regulation protein RsbU (phosphoserine phosphatase)
MLILVTALLIIFTGRRSQAIDRFGMRADLAALAATLLVFVVLHVVAARRIERALERRFSPAPYDERRILFDLGQEARTAINIDQLYKSIVNRIAAALETENVSIFVRDDTTGDYVCRISATQVSQHETSDPLRPRLTFARTAFIIKRLQHLANPLVIEAAELESWDRAFSSAPKSVRESRARERDTLRLVKSNLLVQIRIKEQLNGILSLGARRGQHQYSSSDKEMLMSVAGQLAFVIENSKLIERMVAEERLRRELALAAEVQQRLFPEQPPDSARFELSGFCQPARGVGGDYYDFLQFDNQQTGIAVADVAGKGISAALLMSSVQASLRSQAMVRDNGGASKASPAEMVSTLNRLLCRSTGPATYVTFFYAEFDEQTRRLTYVNAGHNAPLLLRSSDSLAAGHRLTSGGPVIGMFDHCYYEEETLQLESGDLLAAYTDGVTEALNASGEEFGEERLQEALASAAHLPATEVRDSIVQRIRAWCADAPQHDDLTFIVFRVK